MPSSPNFPPTGQVLQVTRSLGGTVVDLHHVDPSPPPRRGPAPRTLVIAGALCLFASTLAFARSVSVSADNDQAYTEAVAAGTTSEFRPRRLGIGHDFLAFGGLVGGIFCIAGALAMARRPRTRTDLIIGESDVADLAWDGVAAAPLVRSDVAQGLVVDIPADCEAVLLIDNLEAVVEGTVSIPAGDKLKIHRGPMSLHVEWAPRPASGQIAAAAQIDQRTLAYAGATAGAFALLLSLIWNLPSDQRQLAADQIGRDDSLRYIQIAARENPLEEKKERGDASGDPSTGEPASAGLEGDMGKPDETATSGRAKIIKISDAEPSVAKRENNMTPAIARQIGILGVMSANREYISHMSSTAEFTNGLDESNIIGGMDGDDYNARHGLWNRGWGGRTSFSSSPYAADWGTRKVGLLPTGGDNGDEYTPFSGDGTRVRDHRAKTPVVKIDAPKSVCSVAGCDKQLIRRYIKKHHARFRYCYEKSLVRKPNLAGTVRTNFMISGTGKVQGANASGIGDTELEGCVANVLASIKFPVVANGDMVSVKYPFHFQHIGR